VPTSPHAATAINTEPPGCRIYCQNKYIGISPLTTTLDGGTFELWTVAGSRKWFTQGGKSDRISWQITAAKDGHESTTQTITVGDGVGDALFDKAMMGYKEGVLTSLPKPPPTITTERPLLLQLRPVSSAVATGSIASPGQPAGSGQLNASRTGQPPYSIENPHPDPQTEYNLALQEYRTALKTVDDLRSLSEVGAALASSVSPRGNPGVFATGAFANGLTRQAALPDAERDLRFAEMRLKNAEERLRQARGGQ